MFSAMIFRNIINLNFYQCWNVFGHPSWSSELNIVELSCQIIRSVCFVVTLAAAPGRVPLQNNSLVLPNVSFMVWKQTDNPKPPILHICFPSVILNRSRCKIEHFKTFQVQQCWSLSTPGKALIRSEVFSIDREITLSSLQQCSFYFRSSTYMDYQITVEK